MVYKNLKRSALFHYGWPLWGCSLYCAPVFPFLTAVLAVKNGNLSPKLELMYFKGYFASSLLM